MAFILRRPFAIASALKQAPTASSTTIRAFHHTPLKSAPSNFFTSRATTGSTFAQSRNVFRNTFRRTYMQGSTPTVQAGNMKQRLLYGAGIFGGAVLATNL